MFDISPVHLLVLAVVLLILFGPDKLPELGKQFGRAIRDLKRTANDFTNAMHTDDDHYSSGYIPPKYDSYGNTHEEYSNGGATLPDESTWKPESKAIAALSSEEPPRGDFASAALSDASSDYGVGLSPSSPISGDSMSTPANAHPEGTVARQK